MESWSKARGNGNNSENQGMMPQLTELYRRNKAVETSQSGSAQNETETPCTVVYHQKIV